MITFKWCCPSRTTRLWALPSTALSLTFDRMTWGQATGLCTVAGWGRSVQKHNLHAAPKDRQSADAATKFAEEAHWEGEDELSKIPWFPHAQRLDI